MSEEKGPYGNSWKPYKMHTPEKLAHYIPLLEALTKTKWEYRMQERQFSPSSEWCDPIKYEYVTWYTSLEDIDRIEDTMGRDARIFALGFHDRKARTYTCGEYSVEKMWPLNRGVQIGTKTGILENA